MNSFGQKLTRGALASVEKTKLTDVVLFQYNPETVTRTLAPRMTGYEPGKGPAEPSTDVGFSDAASQSISFTAYFDAADALQNGDAMAIAHGIAPQLAILESLMNPTVEAVTSAEGSTADGKMLIETMDAPGTVLIWGDRVLPVRIASVTITEEAFDAKLNPLRANAAIKVDVQTYGKRKTTDIEYGRFKAYHGALETLKGPANPAGGAVSGLQSLLDR